MRRASTGSTMPASSRLPELGKRGQGWAVVQAGLIVLVALSALTGVFWPDSVAGTLTILGLALLCAGLLLLLVAVATLVLARAMTVMPRPREGSRVAQAGVYRVVRHPVYGAVLLIVFGAALAESPLGLIPAALLVVVFDLKARLEEAWLLERRPDYAGYRERTRRRFIPGLY
jgi:protein-S-isoprenylcysteine O-methyltransferase Ste14